jgi:hypothetical protein
VGQRRDGPGRAESSAHPAEEVAQRRSAPDCRVPNPTLL